MHGLTDSVYVQPVSAKRESTSSLHKPPKTQNRANPASTGLTKRASLSNNHVKIEKDNAKNASGNFGFHLFGLVCFIH